MITSVGKSANDMKQVAINNLFNNVLSISYAQSDYDEYITFICIIPPPFPIIFSLPQQHWVQMYVNETKMRGGGQALLTDSDKVCSSSTGSFVLYFIYVSIPSDKPSQIIYLKVGMCL